jgi:hypothetical protein
VEHPGRPARRVAFHRLTPGSAFGLADLIDITLAAQVGTG